MHRCPICLGDMDVTMVVFSWQCCHDVHITCAEQQFRTNEGEFDMMCCPICRQRFDQSDYERLYSTCRRNNISLEFPVGNAQPPEEIMVFLPSEFIPMCCTILIYDGDVFMETSDRRMHFSPNGDQEAWVCYKCGRECIISQNEREVIRLSPTCLLHQNRRTLIKNHESQGEMSIITYRWGCVHSAGDGLQPYINSQCPETAAMAQIIVAMSCGLITVDDTESDEGVASELEAHMMEDDDNDVHDCLTDLQLVLNRTEIEEDLAILMDVANRS
jgi:hypothetical protein